MIEIRGDKKVLITPISAEDLADIKIGDIVWLDVDRKSTRLNSSHITISYDVFC